jgi:hypothetical protein
MSRMRIKAAMALILIALPGIARARRDPYSDADGDPYTRWTPNFDFHRQRRYSGEDEETVFCLSETSLPDGTIFSGTQNTRPRWNFMRSNMTMSVIRTESHGMPNRTPA